MKRTPLYDRHVALGAKMVPFGGFEMPVSYPQGISTEHRAVRERVGIFDVSHMGEFEITGPDRNAFVQRITCNDVGALGPGQAQYSALLTQDGTFVMRTLPTLAGVASVAIGDVDKDGVADLVLASPEEEAVSWKSGALPLDQFPSQLACADKPVAVAVDPNGGVLVLARSEKRDAHLDRVAPTRRQQQTHAGRRRVDREPGQFRPTEHDPAQPSREILDALHAHPPEGRRLAPRADGRLVAHVNHCAITRSRRTPCGPPSGRRSRR